MLTNHISKPVINSRFNIYSILVPIGFILFALAIGFVGGIFIAPALLARKNNSSALSVNELITLGTNSTNLNPEDISVLLAWCDQLKAQSNSFQIPPKQSITASLKTMDFKYKSFLKRTVAKQSLAVELIINKKTIYNQKMPSSTLLTNGNLLITWTSEGQDGNREGVFGNILDANNLLLDNEFQMNTVIEDAQYNSKVTATDNYSFAAWLSSQQFGTVSDIVMQRFTNVGEIINNEVIVNNPLAAIPRVQPQLVALNNTNILVVWTSYGQINLGTPNIFGSILTSNLTVAKNEFRLDSQPNAYLTSIINTNDGFFVGVWQTSTGAQNDIYMQRFDILGNTIGSVVSVNTFQAGDQIFPAAGAFINGGVVSSWESNNQDGSSYGIYAQWFDSLNNKLGNETQVNTYTSQSQQNPSLAVLPDGSTMIAWQSAGQDGSDFGIYAQWFDVNRNKLGREFQVNFYTLNSQDSVVVTQLPAGKVAFTWESFSQDGSDYGVITRILTPRLDPFIYNADIPLTLDQKTPQNGTNFVLNPMVDADTVTVTLTPSEGIHLSAVNKSSYSYGNATVVEDGDTGEISISGHAVPVNLALNQLVVTPVDYFSGNASIAIHATDGGLHTDFNATVGVDVVPVDYKPDLTTVAQMDIYQNIPFKLTDSLFNASNPDPNVRRPIIYDIGSALHVTFYNTTSTPAVQVISFTDTELSHGVIEAVPDDSGLIPSFTLQARDSETGLTSDVTTVNIGFTARPILELDSFAINSDKTFTFTTDNLQANGGVYPANSVWQFAAIQHAQVINPKTNIKWPMDGNGAVTVTQADVANGLVGIKPNGKSTSPAFNVAFGIPTNVAGQYLYSRASAAQINFNYVAKSNAALIGGVVGGVTGLLALTGLGVGIAACVKHKKKEQAILDAQAANRQAEPLANAVWEKLGSPEAYADFTSEAGLAFVGAVNHVLQKVDQQVSYKDNYAYFGEVFVAAMKTNDIAVEHISDNTKQISTYINKNWDEAEAVKVQEENATVDYHADREVLMNRV